jgi:hypothetical protein
MKSICFLAALGLACSACALGLWAQMPAISNKPPLNSDKPAFIVDYTYRATNPTGYRAQTVEIKDTTSVSAVCVIRIVKASPSAPPYDQAGVCISSTRPEPDLTFDKKVVAGPLSNEGYANVDLVQLLPGVKYYVKAYLITNNSAVTGSVLSFTLSGPNPAVAPE